MSLRLKAIADVFPIGNILVDVGCDLGHLGLDLLKENKTPGVINIDISPESIMRCREEYKKQGYLSRGEFLHNDGFTGIKKFDHPNVVVVISGLGTIQIINILQKLPSSVNHMILLSHTDCFKLREWTQENGWFIKNEKYVDDNGRVYIILDLLRSSDVPELTFEQRLFGDDKFWSNKIELFVKYWKDRYHRILKIPHEFRSKRDKCSLEFLVKRGYIKNQSNLF